MIKNIFSAAVRVATLPVAMAVDTVTMGGLLIDVDNPKSATIETFKGIAKDVRKISD